jgi:hypothetical protein
MVIGGASPSCGDMATPFGNALTPDRQPMAKYALAGLRIASEVPLPASLRLGEDVTEGDEIVVRYAPVPASLPSATAFPEAQYDGNDLLIDIAEAGRFLVRKGAEILVDPVASASESDVSAFLLGTVFGALCHQRGIVPFHASTIEVSAGCIAFAGPSGAGKSTLAAALWARGHQVISDDVCFLRRTQIGNVMVWPGIGRIRLWADAVEALGYDASNIEREFRGLNKFILPLLPRGTPQKPSRLLRVYQLETAGEGESPGIERLQGAPTIELLVPNVYRLTLAEYMGRKPGIFSLCGIIAQQVPVFRFRRQLGFDVLPRAIDCLETHLADVV